MRLRSIMFVCSSALGLCAALALGGAANAAPAASSAASTYYSCPAYNACLWEDSGLVTNGHRSDYHPFSTFDRTFSNNDYLNTRISVYHTSSSMVNNGIGGGSAYVTLFTGTNCSGSSFTKPPHSYDMNFNNGTPQSGFNDALRSGAFDGSYLTQCQNP